MLIKCPEQIKCYTDLKLIRNGYLTLLFITLNVQGIHLPFLKKYSFHSFCDFIF